MYALITRDLTTILKERSDVTPVDPASLDPSKPYWVPINNITDDQSTGSDTVTEALVTQIFADRVERVTVIRDRTQQEIDAADQSRVDSYVDQDGIKKAIAKVLFDLVNEVRTLNSQPTITAAQFKTYLKSLMR